MPDTHILDATIATLKGSPAAKRTPRVAAAVVLHYDEQTQTYTLQVGSRVAQTDHATKDEAVAIAQRKQAALVALLRKPVSLTIY